MAQVQNKSSFRNRKPALQIVHEEKLIFKTTHFIFEVLGRLSVDISDMTVMLVIAYNPLLKRYRRRIDLYDYDALISLSEWLSQETNIDVSDIENDLTGLTDLLEKFREENRNTETEESKINRKSKYVKQALEILRSPNLMGNLNQLLFQAGVLGDKKLRSQLVVAVSSYLNTQPLHLVFSGSNLSGKHEIVNALVKCMNEKDVHVFSRLTDKSFYYFPSESIHEKLIVLNDIKGISDGNIAALKELQECQKLILGTTKRDRFGKLKPTIQKIEARFASIVLTQNLSNDAIDFPNAIHLHLDEDEGMTRNFIESSKNVYSVDYDENQVLEAQMTLRALLYLLKSKKVVIPFVDKLKIQTDLPMMKRMFMQFLNVITQITLIRQYQRKTDEQGRLIAETEDLELAFNLFGTTIFKSRSDFSGSLKLFHERLVTYLQTKSNQSTNYFTSTEIREALDYNRVFVYRCLDTLIKEGIVFICGGTSNRGFHYQLSSVNPLMNDMKEIQIAIQKIIKKLKLNK